MAERKTEKLDYLQKEVFEVHMKYVQTSLEGIRDMSIKIMDRLDKQDKTLYRNTLTVEEHHRRSNNIERRQDEFITALRSIKDDFRTIVSEVDKIKSELPQLQAISDENSKIISKVTWLNDNKGLILKMFVISGAISIILYIVLKDVEAIKEIIKVIF
jgi:DNA repair ATPase RecN